MKKYIVENKLISYVVKLESNGIDDVLKFAEKELNYFITKATEAIENATQVKKVSIILRVDESLLKQKDFNSSTYHIYTMNNQLVISGGTSYGVLYGVYETLNKLVGLKFYSKTTYKINYQSHIEYPTLDILDKPDFEYRHIGFHDATNDPVFASRMRLMSNYMSFKKDYPDSKDIIKGSIYYDIWGGLWAHTMLKILPIEKNEHSVTLHPEWYSKDEKQMCFTNEHAKAAFIKNLKLDILKWPSSKFFMIGVMDEYAYCNCVECQKSHQKSGGPSGTHIRFINEVANEIETWQQKELPNSSFKLVAFAYLAYKNAPVIEKDTGYEAIDASLIMPNNTAILIAPLDMDSVHTITEESNTEVKKRFLKWKAITKNVIVWDYHIYFDNYLTYLPNIHNIQENLKFYHDCGAIFVYSEGAIMDFTPGFHDLKVFLLSELKWNLNQDTNALIKEFMHAYYKGASAHMTSYLALFDKHFKDLEVAYKKLGNRGYIGAFEISWQLDFMNVIHWPKEFLIQAKSILNDALNAVKGDLELENRVKVELITVQHLWIELHMSYSTKGEILDEVNKFEALVDDTGIKYFKHGAFTKESEKPEHFIRRKIEIYRALYPVCLK